MAIITKIEVQQKNKERVNLYIDDVFFAGINAEIVYDLRLKKGDEVDKEKLEQLIHKEGLSKAKNKAMSILNRKAISEKDLRQKLSADDYSPEVVDEVIDKLKEYGFIDDKSLAQRIANDNSNLSRFGTNKIKQNLYKKGIGKEDIQEVIETISTDEQLDNAIYLARKRYDRVKGEDKRKVYQKLSQHLLYKGFSYDIVKKAIDAVLNED